MKQKLGLKSVMSISVNGNSKQIFLHSSSFEIGIHQKPYPKTICSLNPVFIVTVFKHCEQISFYVSKSKRQSAPLYRHWGSVQAVRPIGGVEV